METKAGRKPSKALFEDGTYDIDEFHRVFVELEDPTGYKAALQLIGDWQEWQRLCRDWPGFNDYIKIWREEIVVRLQSKAIGKMTEIAYGDSPQAATAAKWVAEQGWEKKAGRGRPTKAEKEREAKELARATNQTDKEFEAMQQALKVIDGGK